MTRGLASPEAKRASRAEGPSVTDAAWTADIDVDAALAAKLVAAQFPQFGGAALEPFGFGWDNAAFLAGGSVVFRFPRRRSVAHLIEREIALLPYLAGRLPLPIPAPRFVGTPTAEYPWAFAGYPSIPGRTACSVSLSEAQRAAMALPLAEFLRALHAVDPAPLVASGLPPDEFGRLDYERRVNATRERVPSLAAAGGLARPEAFAEWLEAHPPVALDPGKRRVVHGDLYARHVLVDTDARPSGIIDWGDIHLGDPAIDIAIAHLMLPESSFGAFRDAYGSIDERTWSVARYRAIYHAVLELDYGIRTGDAGMRDIGITALQRLQPD